MNESFVYAVNTVTCLSFVFLIQKIVVSFDIRLSTNHTWSLSVTTILLLCNRLKLSNMGIMMRFRAE
jgi:hypothetical protein